MTVKDKKEAVTEAVEGMITRRIAEFVVETGYRQIPGEAIKIAKGTILDNLGCALAGAREPAVEIVTRYVSELGSKPEVGVIARGFWAAAPLAALVNGTMAHVLDYDDVAATWFGHPTAVLMPTAMAMGEKYKMPGEAVLEAYILGFEVGARINMGLTRAYYEGGWHATIATGTMAAAVVAAKMMKLDVQKIRVALGIAASLAGGLKRNFGTMTKSFHAGTAAQNGIIAASLAKEGFTAEENILEAPQGYCQMFGRNYKLDNITDGLGSSFHICSTGIAIKPYPCCRGMHQSIDAILHIIEEHDIKAADVVEVECRTLPYLPVQLYHHRPKTGLEGKFSIEYCMAAALIDRCIRFTQFQDKMVNRSDAQELLQKVRYTHPEKIDPERGLFREPQTVTVRLKDGRELRCEVTNPKGDPANPLSQEELEDKFRDCARAALSTQDIDRCLEMVSSLESLKDVSLLMGMLTSSKD
ncbi:MmgE/PrpD family protein [Chloroflexota bacterium]